MKCLIVKTSSLGDIIQVFPVIQFLKSQIPEIEIDWMAEGPFTSLLEAHPDLNRVIPVHTKIWRRKILSSSTWKEFHSFRRRLRETTYDVAFDLQGNMKSALLLSQAKAKQKVGFGWKSVSEWPNHLFTSVKFDPPGGQNIRDDYLFLVQNYFGKIKDQTENKIALKISQKEKEQLKNLLKNSQGLFKVLVCPGSAWQNKQLPIETLVSLLKKMQDKQPTHFYLAWGTPQEQKLALELSYQLTHATVADRMPLPMLQNLMQEVDLVVAMDSLPLHLCGTTSTPSLSFFGPSLALKYKPNGKQHLAVQGTCPYGVKFEKRCPKLRTCTTAACIKTVAIEEDLLKQVCKLQKSS